MAPRRRGKPKVLLRHSDQGNQDTSEDFQRLLADQGLTCSVRRMGEVVDNATRENFFSTLKLERVGRRRYRACEEARADHFDYIERINNLPRRHSRLGTASAREYELRFTG
jgi:putative transposase